MTSNKTPKRIQRKRTKGWRKPKNTIYVGRGSKWGNSFTGPDAVIKYRQSIMPVTIGTIKKELRGKNLMCWCPLDKPCHADILLEIANK